MKILRTGKAAAAIVKARDNAPAEIDFDTPALVRLESRFKELQSQAFRDLVEAAAELGAILHEAQRILDRNFLRWVDRLGTSRASAYNYMAVADLARKSPHVIEKWKELGPSKIYQLARLPVEAQREVLKAGKRDELLEMNDREFAGLVKPHMPKTKGAVTPARKATGLRQKAQSWRTQLGEFRTYFSRHKDEEPPAELVKELQELRKALDSLLGVW